jgi:predicted ATP-dependent endonuclease of OLD family
VTGQSAQAVLTSHSPAILGRIKPEEVRHFRLDIHSRTAIIKEIQFSYDEDDVVRAKYIREAVNAYPELYFARFVILGEGDSEQVVLPKLALAMGLEVDPAFVAIVPLGGRHVNYFWRLLNDLHIPHATLLDLDNGRKGAGWGRIKYAFKQLLAVGIDAEQLLKFTDNEGKQWEFSKEEVEQLHEKEEIGGNHPVIKHLEKFGVFFSYPVDLDMAMLTCFTDVYKATASDNRGPKIPEKESPRYQEYITSVLKAVISDEVEFSTYAEEFQELLPWYRYLFLTNSKPSTHLQALSLIPEEELAKNAPIELKNILNYTNNQLSLNQV